MTDFKTSRGALWPRGKAIMVSSWATSRKTLSRTLSHLLVDPKPVQWPPGLVPWEGGTVKRTAAVPALAWGTNGSPAIEGGVVCSGFPQGHILGDTAVPVLGLL